MRSPEGSQAVTEGPQRELIDVSTLEKKRTNPLIIAGAIAAAIGTVAYGVTNFQERRAREEAAALQEDTINTKTIPVILKQVEKLTHEDHNPHLFKINIPDECRMHLVTGLLDKIKETFLKTHPQLKFVGFLGTHKFDYSHNDEMIVYIETEPQDSTTKNE